MKKLYWRPGKISWKIHLMIMLTAITGIILVENLKFTIEVEHYDIKIRASQIMQDAITTIKDYRVKNNIEMPIDPEIDPMESGLIGPHLTPITTKSVSLEAKQITVNPNWAAVIIEMFKQAKLERGDTIGAAFSGSFPAMNIAVLAAAEAMGLKIVLISSLGSSTFGANIPELNWLVMEDILHNKRIITSRRSVGYSLGGTKDIGVSMTKDGRDLLKRLVQASNTEFIYERDPQNNIDQRLKLYNKYSEEKIKLFVNVGGNTYVAGKRLTKNLYRQGLIFQPSYQAMAVDSVMARFAKRRVPLINIRGPKSLARKYQFPIEVQRIPVVGRGRVFATQKYNKILVGIVLFIIASFLLLFIKMDIGYRIFSTKKSESDKKTNPGQMV